MYSAENAMKMALKELVQVMLKWKKEIGPVLSKSLLALSVAYNNS